MALKVKKLKSPKYPKKLETLGDHIRKRRLDLGLFQKEVAEKIGVDETTIYNWERNATNPPNRHIPRIIEFLGCNPLPNPNTLAEKLIMARKTLGLSQKAMAKWLGVDPTTLARWEKGIGKQSRKQLEITNSVIR